MIDPRASGIKAPDPIAREGVEVPSNEVTVLNADPWLTQPQQLAQILAHAWARQVIPDRAETDRPRTG
jgi:hypothetical protein